MGKNKRKVEEDEDTAIWTPPPSIPGGSKSLGGYPNPMYSGFAPLAKRQRKKDPDADQSEKRAARIRKSCPKNILERVDRVMSQRFFMIDRSREGADLREEFSVLGSTGNVYTVVIDREPSCSCPDSLKGNHCKHILFIYLKVLQVSYDSGYWYQKALLTSELAEIFAHAPHAPNSVTNPRIQAAYNKAVGKETSFTAQGDNSSNRRIPGPGDDCPVCYETMHQVDTKKLAFCEQCGNALHTECFQQWAKATYSPTCVFCRAKWTVPGSTAAGSSGSRISEGYINLGDAAGVSTVRDTSSYYHGPRRGSRYYGYQDYDFE